MWGSQAIELNHLKGNLMVENRATTCHSREGGNPAGVGGVDSGSTDCVTMSSRGATGDVATSQLRGDRFAQARNDTAKSVAI
ncbi:MAG: hypothetical protein HQ553_06880 [Chloroflexi bacterium]|nr:hypothetical protein [Chloroflexota bacterium]